MGKTDNPLLQKWTPGTIHSTAKQDTGGEKQTIDNPLLKKWNRDDPYTQYSTIATGTSKRVLTPELDKAVGNDTEETPWYERVRDTLETGTAKAMDALQIGMLNAEEGLFEAGGKVAEWAGAAGGRDAVNKSPFDWLYDKADEARAEADAVRERAYTDTGKAGQFALQAIEGGSKLATDVAVAGLTGLPTMAVTGAGAFGSGAYEAEQDGATLNEALAYGAASAGLEVGIEKITGGLDKIYGKSLTGDFVEGLLKRAAGNETAQWALQRLINAAGEGGEEALTTALSPFLKAIYDKGEATKESYGTAEGRRELANEALYSAALGAAIGAAGDLATGGLSEYPGGKSPLIIEQEQKAQNKPEAMRSTDATAPAFTAEPEIATTSVVYTLPQNGPVVNEQGSDMPGGAQGEPPPVNSDFDRSTEGQPGGTERTSQTPYTVRNARVTPEEMRGIIDRKGAEGEYNYWAITNDETVQRASEAIAREGWDSAYAAWVNDVKNGKAGDQVTATGAILYNHALSAGNKALAADILLTYQDALRNTARGLQAGKIIQQLSPDSRLYMIQRSIDRHAADMGIPDDVVLSDELKQAYRDAKTEADRSAVIEQMQKEVAAQLPTSPMEKWVALRYVNMLGNFKTQIRNVGGNVTSRGLSGIRNAVRTSIESLVYSKKSGKRTSSYFVGKKYMDAGRSDFRDNMKDAVLSGGKYSDTSPQGFMRGVQDQKRIFSNPLLEGYRKATNWAMETGDRVFSEEAYARAIAGWMKAKGISADQFRAMLEAEKAGNISAQDSKRLSDARMFAKQEAQEITFRDDNAFSNWISKIGRRKDTPKAAKILAEGALPFRKTPANVFVRAVEYSPIGMVEAAYKLVQSRKPGSDITGADVINSLSKSLTGTGLFLLGAALKNAGWLTGGEDDRKQDAFNDLRGEQAWALFLPDGTNFTLDWASSIAFPLFMGAEFAAAVGDDGVQWADLDDAMLSIVDPLLEFSMMQGISDTLDSVKYSENNLIQLAAQTAVGYLSQVLTNSLFGQAERSTEGGRKETYIDRDSGVPVWVQQSIGKASAKTPGWDYNQVDYVDAWGRTQDYGKGNLFNQFLNPSYVSTDRSTAADDELQRLYDLGYTGVFPQRFAQSDEVTTRDAEGNSTGKRHLTAEEYEQFNRTMGQTRLELTEALLKSEQYKAMDDDLKAKAIDNIYAYGRAVAMLEVEPNAAVDGWIKRAMESSDPAKYIQVYSITKNLEPLPGNDSVTKYQELGAIVDNCTESEADEFLPGYFSDMQNRKYEMAREHQYSPKRIIELYTAYNLFGTGEDKRGRAIQWLMDEKGWPQNYAEELYDLWKISDSEKLDNWRW